MTQTERRIYLIQRLLNEQPRYQDIEVPQIESEQRILLRSLLNIRAPREIDDDFLTVQDEYLQEETAQKAVTDLSELSPVSDGLYLWQGDITTLRCDAIVNAANSGMTGCYVPCHKCIDNHLPSPACRFLRWLLRNLLICPICARLHVFRYNQWLA